MPQYAVTAATGRLGPLVVDSLIGRGVDPGDIVAIARTPEKGAELVRRGVEVRHGDYNRPETLRPALDGVDIALLISGNEVGQRVPQHTAVVDAAKDAGAGRILYTSILKGDASPLSLAPEHVATETVIRESGVPFTFLRNSSYIENYTDQLGQYVASGSILGATDDAPIAGAARRDFAAAAAAAMVGDGHENAIYELGGPVFTMTDFAATVSDVVGTPVAYVNMPEAELVGAYTGFGMDAGTAAFLASLDRGVAEGGWDASSADLEHLLGRPATSLTDVVRAAADS